MQIEPEKSTSIIRMASASVERQRWRNDAAKGLRMAHTPPRNLRISAVQTSYYLRSRFKGGSSGEGSVEFHAPLAQRHIHIVTALQTFGELNDAVGREYFCFNYLDRIKERKSAVANELTFQNWRWRVRLDLRYCSYFGKLPKPWLGTRLFVPATPYIILYIIPGIPRKTYVSTCVCVCVCVKVEKRFPRENLLDFSARIIHFSRGSKTTMSNKFIDLSHDCGAQRVKPDFDSHEWFTLYFVL